MSGVRNGPITEALFDEVRTVLGMIQSSGSALQFVVKRDRLFRELTHEDQPELNLA